MNTKQSKLMFFFLALIFTALSEAAAKVEYCSTGP
ncbi:unnamed protein product [Brassica napus]|uniref:(rape) hypothetical protein n=1 Tax=Brassica napus TaxID=3708 RepID=A0A816QT36_BRANA|nr:unnamed protein product [Brassica napus]CAF2063858.1 unnamed protein product [Brassica napus]